MAEPKLVPNFRSWAMSYGDPKVVIEVSERADKALEYTSPDGVKHTYYPGRRISLDLQELQVWRHLKQPKDDVAPTFALQLQGVARLEDYGIAVIGEPTNNTRSLKVVFEPGDLGAARAEAESDPENIMLTPPVGRAFLGFSRADWEIGNSDEWWLSCYVTTETLEGLSKTVISGSAKSVKLGVRLSNIYSDDHPMAPASSKAHLFLRPDKKDNSINYPENASGYVLHLSVAETAVDMRPIEIAEHDEAQEHMELRAAPPDPVAAALDRLAVAVASLRSSVKWVGGIAAAALVILAFK
jgi:hypothetical protein